MWVLSSTFYSWVRPVAYLGFSRLASDPICVHSIMEMEIERDGRVAQCSRSNQRGIF